MVSSLSPKPGLPSSSYPNSSDSPDKSITSVPCTPLLILSSCPSATISSGSTQIVWFSDQPSSAPGSIASPNAINRLESRGDRGGEMTYWTASSKDARGGGVVTPLTWMLGGLAVRSICSSTDVTSYTGDLTLILAS